MLFRSNYWYFDRVRHMDQGFAEYDNEDARLHTAAAGKGPEETHGSSSKEQSDKAISFVDRHASDRWMLWVHYYDPHAAYEAHDGIKAFGTDAEARYDGEIEFTDLHLGRVFDELRAKEKERPCARMDERRVLAEPAEARAPSEVALEKRAGVDVRFAAHRASGL